MIVVFDASIWISAIRFGGMPRHAIEKAILRDQIATSAKIEQEIVAVLVRNSGIQQSTLKKPYPTYWSAPSLF